MKFLSLKLYNFGSFRGSHTLNFNPVDGKPIALIGALNGSGKTTILEAIQLVMFGKLANIQEGSRASYEKTLRSHYNIHANDNEMSLELDLVTEQGLGELRPPVITVRRIFKVSKQRVSESLEVLKDKVIDNELTYGWHDFITQHIPVSLSSLFFFDGERIAEFAASNSMPNLIKQGLESLLGLDVINTLIDDLNRVSNDIQHELANKNIYPELDALEDNLSTLNRNLQSIQATHSEKKSELHNAQLKLNRARRNAQLAGYDSLQDRDALTFELQLLQSKLQENNSSIAQAASRATPLFLIKNKLDILRKSLIDSEQSNNKEFINNILSKYRDFVGTDARSNITPNSPEIQLFIDELSRELTTNYDSWYSEDRYKLLASDIYRQKLNYEKLIEAKHSLKKEIERCEALLNQAPQESEIRQLIDAVKMNEQIVNSLEIELRQIAEQEAILENELRASSERYNSILKRKAQHDFDLSSASLTLDNATSGIEHLKNIKRELLIDNLSQVERKITDLSSKLFRKSGFISKVSIEPMTYTLNLYSSSKQQIELESLSAGERQLLVVSILWAFISLSGRDVPIIIDTPLGRLDSKHREKLLHGYFPYASKQVILLSTDEEVRPKDLAEISHNVSQTLSLNFSEKEHTTVVNYEYFK